MTDRDQLQVIARAFQTHSIDIDRFLGELENLGVAITRFGREMNRYAAALRIFTETLHDAMEGNE